VLLAWACQPTAQQQSGNSPTTDTLGRAGYLALGDSIAAASQRAFVAALNGALAKGGPTGAVDFCHVRALPLADSLAEQYSCTIGRVSDRYRNPQNCPSPADSLVLAKYHNAKRAGEPLAPVLAEAGEQVVYYKPILVGMLTCLRCHGDPKTDIDPATQTLISQKYPADLATGYQQGDLRGLWRIAFTRQ
jgi:hypothetical protein